MKKVTKITMVVVLFAFLAVNVFIGTALNEEKNLQVSGSEIVIQLKSSEKMDFSSIILDVYSAELDLSASKNSMLQYNETLAFSRNFNENGVLRFTKPTECFSVSIDLESLPSGYGVDMHTRFFHSDDTSYSFMIERVDRVNIECVQGSYSPVLKNKDGIVMYAPVQIEEQEAYSTSVEEALKKITVTDKYVVDFSGKSYTFFENREINYSNEVEKLKNMYSLGIITQDKYIEGVVEYLLNPVNKSNPDKLNKIQLIEEIKGYKAKNKLSTSIVSDDTIQQIEAITYVDSRDLSVYVVSATGKFRVYYRPLDPTNPEDTTGISIAVAQAVANEFESIYNMFINTMGFVRPFSETSTTAYRIELWTEDEVDATYNGAKAFTRSFENGYSETVIPYDTAEAVLNGSDESGYPDADKGVLAHEYMHAIMSAYGIYSEDDQIVNWFHEAFASWAGVKYTTDYCSYVKEEVGIFLNTYVDPIYYSSGNSARWTGALLYPMYIDQQTTGGVATIKRILELYSNSNDSLTAISAGLLDCGYNPSAVFARCAAFNSDPNYFYSGITAYFGVPYIFEIPSYPANMASPIYIENLACDYLKFIAPNTVSTLTVTVDYTASSGASANLYTVRQNGNDKYVQYHTTANDRFTVVQSQFGTSNINSLTLVPSNGGTSGLVGYMVSARLDSECVQVAFDANGGYCDTAYKIATPGGTYGQLPIPTRPGYTFVGWWNVPNQELYEITSNTTISATTNHTIYAHWAKTYKITNVGAGKCLNIYGDNVTWLYNGQNVTLWSDSGTNEQKWLKTEALNEGFYLRSVIDRSYGLNVYRAGDPYNCNVHTVIGNEIDAQLDLIAVDGGYKIKLVAYDLYLTAGSSADGANVYWAPASSSDYQKWTLTEVN